MTDTKIQDPRYPPAKTTELQVEQGGQQIEAVLEKANLSVAFVSSISFDILPENVSKVGFCKS